MKLAITANDRTYSIQIPWWFLLAALCSVVLWQPAAAWASTTFSDVPSSHLFHDDIDWMATTGVTKGCGTDEFCPEDYVTRGQMAAFMHRFADTVDDSDPAVESRVTSLESEVAALESENDDLKSLLAGVTRNGDRLLFSGMDLQVVNGTGTTDGTPNGLGNLIVGYDAPRSSGSDKSGSHYLVVGDEHNYTASGGIVAGFNNTASGTWASVTGGRSSTASHLYSSVSGGYNNTAGSFHASVSGGSNNTASSNFSSVSGGNGNTAGGGFYTSVSGGNQNTASGYAASVSGGSGNTANGLYTSVLGGHSKTASTNYSCHPSCV